MARQDEGSWIVPRSSEASSSVVPMKSYERQASTSVSDSSWARFASSPVAASAPVCSCCSVVRPSCRIESNARSRKLPATLLRVRGRVRLHLA